jgi:hypothetical protein
MVALNWGDLVKDAGDSASGSYEPLPDGDYDLKVIEASSTPLRLARRCSRLL